MNGGQVGSESDRIYRELGYRIKIHREGRNMSQKDLGESIGRSERTVERYEVGKQAMDLHMVYRLADALGVGVGRLVTPVTDWKYTQSLKSVAKSVKIKQEGGD